MKLQSLLPVAVFLGVSIPVVLLMQALGWGGENRVWVALVAGAVATALVQRRLARKENQ